MATSVGGPCSFVIDAAWGYGKTTFLRLWKAHLQQDAFLVIKVNAWETDYFDDPFLGIVGEMTKQLESSDRVDFSITKRALGSLRNASVKVSLHCSPCLWYFLDIGITGEDFADIIASTFKTEASIRLEQYERTVGFCKGISYGVGETLPMRFEGRQEKPLIVLIDELDRCRPTYAVEFLEVVKHLMAVDHVVYAFAVNRSELAHTVCGCYGPEFDGRGILASLF